MTGLPDQRWERLAGAHAASRTTVRATPVLTSASLSERCGGTVALKAECLQRTGSFKLRGALAKLRAIGGDAPGVVAGSAGNHGQSLAYAARHHGIPCEVFMPVDAAVSKVAAVRAFGATVHQEGASVDDCVALAVRETGVALTIETRGAGHLERVVRALASAGYDVAED